MSDDGWLGGAFKMFPAKVRFDAMRKELDFKIYDLEIGYLLDIWGYLRMGIWHSG